MFVSPGVPYLHSTAFKMATFLLAAILCGLTGSSLAVKTTVLPARAGATGPPAGLLILPGAFLLPEQYKALAEAVQIASTQRLYVGLSGGFIADVINPIEMPDALEDGVNKLRQAGLPRDAPIFAAGHSLAGVFLSPVALDQAAIKGLLMYASYLPEGNLVKYKLPVLSVSGDLDGQTRLTRVIKSYREVDTAAKASGNSALRLKYPVSVLKDVNHAHFATGKMPELVEQEDIPSPLGSAAAKKLIAKASADFISYHTQKDESSKKKLEQAWETTSTIVEPFLVLMSEELSADKKTSPWVSQAQRVLSTLSEQDLGMVDVNNQILEADFDFPISKPDASVINGRLVVNTTANVKYDTALPTDPQTAQEIEGKLKRQEALKQETDKAGLRLNFGTPVSCKAANQASWERALGRASDIARKRFTAKKIEVRFEEDDKAVTGPGWLLGNLIFKLEGSVLRVKSVSLVTDLDIILGVAGMNYCKLLSPARALEFIYIDALKKPRSNF